MRATMKKPGEGRAGRHLRAWQLKEKGLSQQEIASVLGVHQTTISRWLQTPCEPTVQAVENHKQAGRKPKLTTQQQARLRKVLDRGAKQYGFWGDFWTRARIRTVIQREFGVDYAENYIGYVLAKIGWHLQKPKLNVLRRAKTIEQWRSELQNLMGNTQQ